MVRLIFKRTWQDNISGDRSESFETVDMDIPVIEEKLSAGGFGESGFDRTDLIGVEILTHNAKLTG